MRNYNRLIDLYPGADGMKTGFICASGFNLVASATRGNRRLVAVVLGAPSASVRTYKAAKLLEQGFNNNRLTWLMPTLGTVDQLVPIAAAPPNLREDTCGKKRKRPAAEDEEVEVSGADGASPLAFLLSNLQSNVKVSDVLANGNPMLPPVDVFVGAVKPSSVAAAEAQESQIVGGGKRSKKNANDKGKAKTKVAAKPKPDVAEKPDPAPKATGTKTAAKPAAADKPEPTAKPKGITTGAQQPGHQLSPPPPLQSLRQPSQRRNPPRNLQPNLISTSQR